MDLAPGFVLFDQFGALLEKEGSRSRLQQSVAVAVAAALKAGSQQADDQSFRTCFSLPGDAEVRLKSATGAASANGAIKRRLNPTSAFSHSRAGSFAQTSG